MPPKCVGTRNRIIYKVNTIPAYTELPAKKYISDLAHSLWLRYVITVEIKMTYTTQLTVHINILYYSSTFTNMALLFQKFLTRKIKVMNNFVKNIQ